MDSRGKIVLEQLFSAQFLQIEIPRAILRTKQAEEKPREELMSLSSLIDNIHDLNCEEASNPSHCFRAKDFMFLKGHEFLTLLSFFA